MSNGLGHENRTDPHSGDSNHNCFSFATGLGRKWFPPNPTPPFDERMALSTKMRSLGYTESVNCNCECGKIKVMLIYDRAWGGTRPVGVAGPTGPGGGWSPIAWIWKHALVQDEDCTWSSMNGIGGTVWKEITDPSSFINTHYPPAGPSGPRGVSLPADFLGGVTGWDNLTECWERTHANPKYHDGYGGLKCGEKPGCLFVLRETLLQLLSRVGKVSIPREEECADVKGIRLEEQKIPPKGGGSEDKQMQSIEEKVKFYVQEWRRNTPDNVNRVSYSEDLVNIGSEALPEIFSLLTQSTDPLIEGMLIFSALEIIKKTTHYYPNIEQRFLSRGPSVHDIVASFPEVASEILLTWWKEYKGISERK